VTESNIISTFEQSEAHIPTPPNTLTHIAQPIVSTHSNHRYKQRGKSANIKKAIAYVHTTLND